MRTINEERDLFLLVGVDPYACLRCGISAACPLGEVFQQTIPSCKMRESPGQGLGRVLPGCGRTVGVVSWRLMHHLRRGLDMTGVPEQVSFLARGKRYVQNSIKLKFDMKSF